MIDPPRTIELERVGSTQDELRVLAREGAPAFTVVRADVQDAGRGRRGRSWHTRPGAAMLASVLLRPTRPAAELASLAIVGGLAAARVAQGLGVDARLRWPNDVVVSGRKLAGVLAELVDGPAILLGVGMNADAGLDDLPETDGLPPTSLRLEGARPATPSELAALLVSELRRSASASTAAASRRCGPMRARSTRCEASSSSWRSPTARRQRASPAGSRPTGR